MNEFAPFDMCVSRVASYVACRTINRAIAYFLSDSNMTLAKKGTPPLESPVIFFSTHKYNMNAISQTFFEKNKILLNNRTGTFAISRIKF